MNLTTLKLQGRDRVTKDIVAADLLSELFHLTAKTVGIIFGKISELRTKIDKILLHQMKDCSITQDVSKNTICISPKAVNKYKQASDRGKGGKESTNSQ